MSVLGVGPRIALVTFVWAAVAGVAHWFCYPALAIEGTPRVLMVVVGCVLLAAGVVLYVTAVRAFRRGRKEGGLMTTGLHAICRHPLYATWVFFIIPGAVLLAGSWLLLSVPLVAYAAARIAIKTEEAELEKRFGEAYRAYRERTDALFPKWW